MTKSPDRAPGADAKTSGPARSARRIFGFAVTPLPSAQIASRIAAPLRAPRDGVGLVVTANIDHVARLRRNAAFAAAYRGAEIVTCDGFPVFWYARLRGIPVPARVTGTEIVADLLRRGPLDERHRLFFVVDGPKTEAAVRAWAAKNGLGSRIETAVPPFGFEADEAQCRALALRIRDHRATILFMGVGAPKSESFVHGQRPLLPPCWALCVGQAIKVEVGLVMRAPRLFQALNLEWLWRLLSEPRRLFRRYATASIAFVGEVLWDLQNAGAPVPAPPESE